MYLFICYPTTSYSDSFLLSHIFLFPSFLLILFIPVLSSLSLSFYLYIYLSFSFPFFLVPLSFSLLILSCTSSSAVYMLACVLFFACTAQMPLPQMHSGQFALSLLSSLRALRSLILRMHADVSSFFLSFVIINTFCIFFFVFSFPFYFNSH